MLFRSLADLVAWRIRQDLLGPVAGIRELAGDASAPGVLRGYWQVEMCLRSLGRLEIRGRDSAGLAVMVHFGSISERDAALEGIHDEVLPQRVICPVRGLPTVVFKFMVAERVGALGYNNSVLRKLVRTSRAFASCLRRARTVTAVAHTRWASAGEISLANVHPHDGSVQPSDPGYAEMRTLCAINGDVDNYVELTRDWSDRAMRSLPDGVTTDAKILPVLIEQEMLFDGDIDRAVERAVAKVEGSMAAVVLRADMPGTMWCVSRGAGQALYLGSAGGTVMAASEVHGLVEVTNGYTPLRDAAGDGEGRIVRFDTDGVTWTSRVLGSDAKLAPPRAASVTTRDVDRRGFSHYFRKELEESIESVRRTIAGRYVRGADGIEFTGLFAFGADKIGAALKEKRVRRFVFVGQGTAARAAAAGAKFLGSVHGISVEACTAGTFSAHGIVGDLSDTCVVAVSQSGTTTDTNRAVAMAREHGALAVGIVNRRDSYLVELCDAVVYTSDGWDVEMAVASTKAFYSQVAAAFMLSRAFLSSLGARDGGEIARDFEELERLPEAMHEALAREPQVAEITRQACTRRNNWSVTGTDASMIACGEVRIKASELAYRAIALDYIEDKKHIDLSSEPLVLCILYGLDRALASDAAKEIAVFAAHRAIPIVFTDRFTELYTPNAAAVVPLPSLGELTIIPATILGHLFAYHAAATLQDIAVFLSGLQKLAMEWGEGGDALSVVQPSGRELQDGFGRLLNQCLQGNLDGVFKPSTTLRVALAAQQITHELAGQHNLFQTSAITTQRRRTTAIGVADVLAEAIDEVSRPIDTIRHQAKTVTVGTSRLDLHQTWAFRKCFQDLDVRPEALLPTAYRLLAALDPTLDAVHSGIRYSVHDLGPLGEITPMTSLQVERKSGDARNLTSRYDTPGELTGLKRDCVQNKSCFVGAGPVDNASLVVIPIYPPGEEPGVLVLHVAVRKNAAYADKRRVLELLPERTRALCAYFSEVLAVAVDTPALALLDLGELLFAPTTEIQYQALDRRFARRIAAAPGA